MLSALREKCAPFMRFEGKEFGVIALKQDIMRLSALRNIVPGGFHVAFALNVLNTVPDPRQALREIRLVLQDGGELRIAGPRVDSDVNILFDAIKRDLESKELFEELQPFFDHLYEFNRSTLKPTFSWTVEDLATMLLEVGFTKIVSRGEGIDAFAGQAMIVCAQR